MSRFDLPALPLFSGSEEALRSEFLSLPIKIVIPSYRTIKAS